MRTTRTTIAFAHPFRLKSSGEVFPAGTYDLETDEEPADLGGHTIYRRVRSLLLVRASGSVRTVEVNPQELDRALADDAATR